MKLIVQKRSASLLELKTLKINYKKNTLARSPYIEDFLKASTAQQADTTAMFDLLWKYYEKNGGCSASTPLLYTVSQASTWPQPKYSTSWQTDTAQS